MGSPSISRVFLRKGQDSIEPALFARAHSLFSLEVDLVLFGPADRLEVRGKTWRWRPELPGVANKTF